VKENLQGHEEDNIFLYVEMTAGLQRPTLSTQLRVYLDYIATQMKSKERTASLKLLCLLSINLCSLHSLQSKLEKVRGGKCFALYLLVLQNFIREPNFKTQSEISAFVYRGKVLMADTKEAEHLLN